MRIERYFTKPGVSPYELVAFATTKSEIRNPDGSVVFSLEGVEVPAAWSQVAADVLAQKYFRKAGVPARLKRIEEEGVPSFLWRSVADETALGALPKDERFGSETSAKQVFDRLAGAWAYWGWKAGLVRRRGRRARLFRRDAAHARAPGRRAQFAAMVQHRPPLGLWRRWAEPGPLLRRLRDGQARQVEVGLRASAAARLLHPVGRRRSRQRGRDHGPLGARGAPVQIRLRHRLQLLASARREREALGRRALVRPDVVLEDRRPRGGRDQVGRHDAPRRQDGGRRRRSSRHRGLYRLEGERGAEGRRARRRLQDRQAALEGDLPRLRQLRGIGRRLLQRRQEPGAQARGEGRAQERRAGRHHQAGHPIRPPGLFPARFRQLRHRLGVGGLSHRVRPELQQFGAGDRRVPAGGRERRRLESDPPPRRQGREDAEGARLVGEDRLRRLGLGRSGHPVSHHHQRLAHLPRVGADPRLQSVLRVHVPRRHGLQSRFAQPPAVPRFGRARRSTSRVTSTRFACGR